MRVSSLRTAAAAAVVLLAAVVPAGAQSVTIGYDNALFVEGTGTDDTIVLADWSDESGPLGVSVTINGISYGNHPLAERSGITVRGYAGNDAIDLHAVSTDVFFLDTNPAFSVTITGDEGDDTIYGTDGNDVIYGNGGNDTVFAQDGNDIVLGGDGDDLLKGQDGHDVIEGEAGDFDVLVGGCGNDKLADKDGVRAARGGWGEDKIIVEFRDGWLNPAGRPRSNDKIQGGYDADYIEIWNHSAGEMLLHVEGDEPRGYNYGGDQIVTFGPFAATSTYDKIELITNN